MATGNVIDSFLVSLGFKVDRSGGDQFKAQLDGIQQAARRVGSVLLGVFGAVQAKRAFIDFNSNMEQAKIQMAGLMEQAGSGKFVDNLDKAATLVRQMQLDARESVGTTKDFVQMASMLVQPITMAGGGMESLRDMTKQSVVASRAMGIASDVAARDVDQAIRGQYRAVDQFMGKLLTPMGFGGEEGRRKFNQMAMKDRMATVQSALASPAILAMAKAQAKSWDGVWSTFVDNLQMGLGKIGIPLFKALTAAFIVIGNWFDRNEGAINRVTNSLGKELVWALQRVYNVFLGLYDMGKRLFGFLGGTAKPVVVGLGLALAAAFAPLKLLVLGIALLIDDLATWHEGGDSFLKTISERYPQAFRMLLSLIGSIGGALLAFKAQAMAAGLAAGAPFIALGVIVASVMYLLQEMSGSWGIFWDGLKQVAIDAMAYLDQLGTKISKVVADFTGLTSVLNILGIGKESVTVSSGLQNFMGAPKYSPARDTDGDGNPMWLRKGGVVNNTTITGTRVEIKADTPANADRAGKAVREELRAQSRINRNMQSPVAG